MRAARCILFGLLCVSACAPVGEDLGPPEEAASLPQQVIEALPAKARLFARRPGADEELELEVTKLAVAVDVRPMTLRTHLDVELMNVTVDQIEAVLRIPIPPGAAVTSAVLHVGPKVMEGAFVARERARAIYEGIVNRRRDPMLITWSDEAIDVQIFPFNPKQSRRFELEWIEPIAFDGGRALYRIPFIARGDFMTALPTSFTVAGKAVELPKGPSYEIELDRAPPGIAIARAPGDPLGFVLAAGEPARSLRSTGVVIAAETSMAMSAKSRRRQREVIGALLAALPKNTRVSLFAVDWTTSPVAENVSTSAALIALELLDRVPSMGALDLSATLERCATFARAEGAESVVFIGLGKDAFPGRDALEAPLDRLREADAALYAIGVESVPPKPIADAAWISGGRATGHDAILQVGRELAAKAARVKPAFGGVDRWYPIRTVTGRGLWIGRYLGGAPAGAERVDVRDLEALFGRSAVRPRSGETDPGERHRVLTPLTSILALESDADYDRFGIEREVEPDRDRARATAANAGLLQLLGGSGSVSNVLGPGGLGAGINNAMGGLRGTEMGDAGGIGRAKSLTRVVPGRTIITGAMSKEMIQRPIRRNMARFKYCYEKQLNASPELSGKISLRFTIAPTGAVAEAYIHQTTMNDRNVESCAAKVMRSLQFPRPKGGGIVAVTYPFFFSTDGIGNWVDRDPWAAAMQILDSGPARGGDVAKIAELLGAPRNLEREALAWWLLENRVRKESPPFTALRFVSSLLYDSEQSQHGERLLSEAATYAPYDVEKELRARGALESAKRVAAMIPPMWR